MPQVNPDKAFVQQPAKRPPVNAAQPLPADWFDQLGKLIADNLLQLEDTVLLYPIHEIDVYRSLTQRSEFFYHLERHAGDASTYSEKEGLRQSLQTLYRVLTDEKTNHDLKHALSHKLHEGIKNCTPGFHNRSNECLESLNLPEHLDDMLSVIRQGIVSMAASHATNEVHTHNRFFMVACHLGYGVRPLNPDDACAGLLSEDVIQEKLKQAFKTRYTLFSVLNALVDQLQALVQLRGYQGEKASGYVYEDYTPFDNLFLKPYLGELLMEQLFASREDENMVPVVTDINWCTVKQALLRKIRDEQYFIFTPDENALLDATLSDDGSMLLPINADSLMLITNDLEISACLAFYRGFSGNISAALSAVCLERTLLIAAQAGKLDDVKKLAAQGAEVNAVLGILIAKHKVAVMNDPELRAMITPVGFIGIIFEGALAGKTVADVWVNSKRGRYWLAEEARLQAILPDTLAGKPKAAWLAQANTEKPTHYARWFSRESHLVKQFLQHIVYGEEDQVEALLETHPMMRNCLLHGTTKVVDYSRRAFKHLTAFQLALCALDNEMCDRLKAYMSEEEITEQYQAIFLTGYEAYAKTQQPFDFTRIVRAITDSRDADVKTALQLQQPNMTELWQTLEQFRRDFTRCSQHEIIFNPTHLQKVFEHYCAKFVSWSFEKRDLFWRQIVGYVQRFLPANIAQDVAQDFYYRVEYNEKSNRTLNYINDDASFYPISFSSYTGLGYEYAAYAGRRQRHYDVSAGGWGIYDFFPQSCGDRFFAKLMPHKGSRLRLTVLMPQLEQADECVIS